MSRHPYHIVDDFLKQARKFCSAESILISPAPPDGDYPFLEPVYQLEQALTLSGYYCLMFHREYWERVRGMRPGPNPLEVRRAIEQIRKAIELRFARWGWDKFLESEGVNGVKDRMVAHHRATYHPLLDAALSWRSALDVSLEEEPYSKCADRLAHYAEGVLSEGPSLTPEEGKRLFPERHGAWYMSPALGTSIPSVTSEEHGLLRRAFDAVSAYHARSVSPEELEREWTQLEREVRDSPYPIPSIGHFPAQAIPENQPGGDPLERTPEAADKNPRVHVTQAEAIELLREYLRTATKPTIREAAKKLNRSLSYVQSLPPWLEHMSRRRQSKKSQSVSCINLDAQVLEAHSGSKFRESSKYETNDIDDRLDDEERQQELERLIREQEQDRRSDHFR